MMDSILRVTLILLAVFTGGCSLFFTGFVFEEIGFVPQTDNILWYLGFAASAVCLVILFRSDDS